ncbi:hypothetical protein L211DRAFT_170200 [Terfezia boudieri ATCC MYA-4762]|uniref:Saccharopine dehydrogenase NADP binding domain-containing protein n=1 Tax=Terfezia boudieri ATCC MYA-4762 TaxID=1051890 RepID=A0A3N4M2I4_9PEZI|nr:hypothetical protein L211DRAFT_170200 [Terfezia boudieri ATCC MYA-4762]
MEPSRGSPEPGIKPMAGRKYDILVVGATGVTGGLITKHLSTNAPNIKWAVSGRSEEKLNKLIDKLPAVPDINKPDILVLDVLNDPESKIRSVLDDTRVVIDVVGPYSYWGEKVLKPCVDAGTAWVDLNGEVPWAKEMEEKYQALAEKTKAVIVPCCGYDCVPSDMGVYLLSRFAGGALGKVDAVVEEAVGAASFGTLSSFLAPYYTYPPEKILKPNGYIGDPYFLYPRNGECPETLPEQPTGVKFRRANSSFVYHAPLRHIGRDCPKRRGGYLITSTPFEAINRPVVMRSYGLRSSVDGRGTRLHDSYGPSFRYREWLLLPAGPLKGGLSMLAAYIMGSFFPYCLSFSPVRGMFKFVIDRLFGPGYGPSPELQERGGFRWRFIGEALDHETKNERAVLQMEGRKDIGYGWTSIILSETALYLVDKLRNVEELAEREGDDDVVFRRNDSEQRRGGFWTSACLGMGLAHRLLGSGYLDVEMRWVRDEEVRDEDKKTV